MLRETNHSTHHSFFQYSSKHYDLGEPVIPDICDEPKTYWLLVEDQHVSFGKGDEYSYASTLHKRAKYTGNPNPHNNFEVTLSLISPDSAGVVVEMVFLDTGTFLF